MENDKNYYELLENIKQQIQQARLQAVLSANAHMIKLYWEIGSMIIRKQQKAGWGAKVIDTLAQDLRLSFPDMKGISPRNLKYMRKFATEYQDFTIVQVGLAQISWYHHITLLDKIKDAATRLWYAQKVIENGWTRDVMVHQIEANLYQKLGNLPNNFKQQLPIHTPSANQRRTVR
jgi:predicted nuclease of restriction endonuclease-like (RecB) superfamily